VKEALRILVEGRDLDTATMEAAIGTMMDGGATPAQTGAFLAALAAKGETVDELVAAVRAMRSRSVRVRAPAPLVDLCGTGGDGLGTFNVSTAASFVAAAGGARVAKHGNRAASSSVGAADVLEALGVRLDVGAERAAAAIGRFGIAFLFAPLFHPAVRHVAGPRRELGFRTVFNLIGPLCNPAGATRQLLGVFASRWLEPIARAAKELGSEHVLVVHGCDGSDEITPTGPTRAVELKGGRLRTFDIDPSDFGVSACETQDLAGGSPERNAAIVRAVLEGAKGPCADSTALNAGAALYVAGVAVDLAEGVARARQVLESKKAVELLDAYAAFTREESAA
jgi:anthranilate phosphoribosyltransferase